MDVCTDLLYFFFLLLTFGLFLCVWLMAYTWCQCLICFFSFFELGPMSVIQGEMRGVRWRDRFSCNHHEVLISPRSPKDCFHLNLLHFSSYGRSSSFFQHSLCQGLQDNFGFCRDCCNLGLWSSFSHRLRDGFRLGVWGNVVL